MLRFPPSTLLRNVNTVTGESLEKKNATRDSRHIILASASTGDYMRDQQQNLIIISQPGPALNNLQAYLYLFSIVLKDSRLDTVPDVCGTRRTGSTFFCLSTTRQLFLFINAYTPILACF